MKNIVAILQSNYIPWKGVFDLINMVDTFVFLDDVDFTYRDWRSRNRIKTPNGSTWLTVPVIKARRGTKIFEVEISRLEDWQTKHYKTISCCYSKAPYFERYKELLDEIYLSHIWQNLSEMNIYVTKHICSILGIGTNFVNSLDLQANGDKDDRLIDICGKLKATEYVSGPSARNYINPLKFRRNMIDLSYIKYDYDEYNQLYGEFDHFVSVIDVLFNCGDNAREYIFKGKKVRSRKSE